MMHLSKTFLHPPNSAAVGDTFDCEKPFAEGVATADASAVSRQKPITAKGDVL